MGYLYYSPQQSFYFDDDILTHLRTVIISKLMQQESFLFTWVDGACQHSIWLCPSTPLLFEFDSNQVPPIDRDRVSRLLELASSAGGLRLILKKKTQDPR